ncbi:uncharacterized protein BDR25DRAFT_90013 [Lindgomyces ingoldianus]|uniref:Uncharacterized protein n=1 Tax=Lindgomyces ingoldianus TaxID=673940 RepID=A0ACB6R9U9_9PLEO|nr:uncharacterized protein BDR25DRAFT_90013 [Lindgomyces ingoldianus]KAF2476039.1 hypothetical protein BDR25DRAFT_90013 [Lindgomyces ingoldianus]
MVVIVGRLIPAIILDCASAKASCRASRIACRQPRHSHQSPQTGRQRSSSWRANRARALFPLRAAVVGRPMLESWRAVPLTPIRPKGARKTFQRVPFLEVPVGASFVHKLPMLAPKIPVRPHMAPMSLQHEFLSGFCASSLSRTDEASYPRQSAAHQERRGWNIGAALAKDSVQKQTDAARSDRTE